MRLLGIAVEIVLSGVGLATWRWLMVAGRPSYRVIVPQVADQFPITLDSDYRGLVL